MATDYDARARVTKTGRKSIEELKAVATTELRQVDEGRGGSSRVIRLPGADLSHEELEVEVRPKQEGRVTCMSCFWYTTGVSGGSKNMICLDCA